MSFLLLFWRVIVPVAAGVSDAMTISDVMTMSGCGGVAARLVAAAAWTALLSTAMHKLARNRFMSRPLSMGETLPSFFPVKIRVRLESHCSRGTESVMRGCGHSIRHDHHLRQFCH